ncbi:CU044_5270 family protein [Promicromonospora sp. NPDC060271]|uniref:CU044_5270 family protein n=1 Tax=Promicromonospora sp. NPDC060271 TaxID=3347089 RepID=UPI00364BDD59
MSTSTTRTGQEPGGTDLDALHLTGTLLDPSEAERETTLRAARARLTAELVSPAAVADGQHEHTAGGSLLRAVRGPGSRRGSADGRRPGGRRPAGGTRRPAVRAAVGLGLAATVAGGLLFAPTATLSMPWENDGGGATVPPAAASAAEILQAAATRTAAAADDSWDEVRGDQFVYYRSTGTNRYQVMGGDENEGVTKISEDYTGWFSVDGTKDGRATATYSVGDPLDTPLYTCENGGLERALADGGGDCSSEPALKLDAPTDPDAMYEYLRDQPPVEDEGPAASMFIRADELLRSLTPRSQAAVFEALSRVDGLIVTPGVTDAIGRPGIAVGVELRYYRQDLIFDPETKDLLGVANSYPDGMTDAQAIVERTIVDEVGQKP